MRIALTASGKIVIERANAERDAADAKLVPGLKKTERRELVALLRKMLAAYEAAEAADASPPAKLGRPLSTRVKARKCSSGVLNKRSLSRGPHHSRCTSWAPPLGRAILCVVSRANLRTFGWVPRPAFNAQNVMNSWCSVASGTSCGSTRRVVGSSTW